jgi:anti-anti-sigma factor
MISDKKLGPETVILNPGKILDNTNAHEMTESICSAQSKGFKNIILDMRVLEFLSSAGVGSILGTVEASRDMGGDIILCGPGDKILHVLEVLDLLDYLTVKPHEEVSREFHLQEVS